MASNSEHHGCLELKNIEFKKLTPSGDLYCVVYAEFDQLFALDPLRNPIIEGVL